MCCRRVSGNCVGANSIDMLRLRLWGGTHLCVGRRSRGHGRVLYSVEGKDNLRNKEENSSRVESGLVSLVE
jgi:hypothetical protein